MSLLCFVSARNLGDAVIHADFLRTLLARGYAERCVVWTFPQAAFLFEDIHCCTVVVSKFPMGATVRSFFTRGIPGFCAALGQIRKMRPNETLELVSDVREQTVCALVGAERNLSIFWERDHPFRRHIRVNPFRSHGFVTIPTNLVGLYDAYALALDSLLGSTPRDAAPTSTAWRHRHRAPRPEAMRIGIHPFASLPCKQWPEKRWIDLVGALQIRLPATQIVLFGSPTDRPVLLRMKTEILGDVELFTRSLPDFRTRLQTIDLLIGLDSFSVHMAHSAGIDPIILVGPNDPRLFTPPHAIALTKPGVCPHQPCGGNPKCLGTLDEYICMTSILNSDVMAAVSVLDDAK